MKSHRSLNAVRLFVAAAILSQCSLFAAMNITELRSHCAPDAPLLTLQAIIRAESGGNPNAIQLDYPAAILRRWKLPKGSLRFARQPRDAAEAIAWTNYLASQGISVDLGLMQVSTVEARRRNVSAAALLDPCTNIRVGWSIFRANYIAVAGKYSDSQIALWHAISRYNTGNDEAGIHNGYLQHIMRCLRIEEADAKRQLTTQQPERSRAEAQNYTRGDKGSWQ